MLRYKEAEWAGKNPLQFLWPPLLNILNKYYRKKEIQEFTKWVKYFEVSGKFTTEAEDICKKLMKFMKMGWQEL